MHISEGILSAPVLIGGTLITLVGAGIGFKKIDADQLPKAGVLSASFFVASLIHVPVGAASIHLTLNGLIGILLGWGAIPVILVALLLQAVLFQFGGITTLGV
ncbi:MAG: cobalamin biosynthesis protein CbiM, partial [Deltaproteobacteria bacterium]|nr:cobalamin biosynthesis protein CbiM [Deltaproteobacteria bacterium]